MVFFVRITVNQSHLRPICKSTKFNPKIQRTIYSINFQRLRLHVLDFIRTVVFQHYKVTTIFANHQIFKYLYFVELTLVNVTHWLQDRLGGGFAGQCCICLGL